MGGFHNFTKWLAVRNHAAGLFVLSETQLQRHLHSTIHTEFSADHVLLSPGQDEKHFTGVAVLAKRASFWAAKSVVWPQDHPRYKFWADDRLLCTQLWCGAGDLSIFCYAVYCPSGARWEAARKSYTHKLLRAVLDDMTARGDVYSFLAGDFNLQVEESFLLRQWKFEGPFYDCSLKSSPDMRDANTCHQGKGSKIDFIWVSRSAYDLVSNYRVDKQRCFPTHSMLSVTWHFPQASQVRRTQKQVATYPPLQPPADDSVLLEAPPSAALQHSIANGDLNTAFHIWCRQAEALLAQIASKQGHHVDISSKAHRGDIKFQDVRFHPPVRGAQATTLVDRKLYKALSRAQEVQKARPGYRRAVTWRNVSDVVNVLKEPYKEQLVQTLHAADGPQAANQAVSILQRAIEQQHQVNRKQRLDNWKRDLRSSDAKQSAWLAKHRRKGILPVATDGRTSTASLAGRAKFIREAWSKNYTAHKNGEPGFRQFISHYGPTLRKAVSQDPRSSRGMPGQWWHAATPPSGGRRQADSHPRQLIGT